MAEDLGGFATVPSLIDRLATRAWALSDPELRNFAVPLGNMIVECFRLAQQLEAQDSAEAERGASLASTRPLRALLAERNALLARLNADAPMSDDEMSAGCARLNAFDRALFESGPLSTDDAAMKLLAAVQIIAEGHEIGEDEAAKLVLSVKRRLGIGYVHGDAGDAAAADLAEQGR